MDNLAIPEQIKRVLECLGQENDDSVKWILTKSPSGGFSIKIWTFPAKNELQKETHKRQPRHGKEHKHPTTRHANVETPPSAGKRATVGPEILEKPESIGRKCRHKPPSRIKRDRQRRATWRVTQQLTRENLQASKKLPENSPPVVLAEPVVGEPKEQFKDATESVVEIPNNVLFPESTDSAVSQITSKSSETNCGREDSVLDSDDESVDPVKSPVKEVPELCVACGKTEGKFYSCFKCKAVKYCGASCQKENWKQHKFACVTLRDLFGE